MKKSMAIFGAAMMMMLLVGGCSNSTKEDLKHIPASYNILVKIDVKKIVEIDAVSKALNHAKEMEEMTKAGLDPRTDVATIYVALSSTSPKSKDAGMLIHLNKKLDVKAFSEAWDKNVPMTEETYNNVKLYKKGSTSVANLDEKIVVFGDDLFVRNCIDLSKGKGKDITTNSALMALCSNGKLRDMIWVASPEIRKANETAKDVLLKADYASETLSITIGARAESAEKAQQSLAQLKGLLPLLPMFTGGILDSSKVTLNNHGDKIEIKVSLKDADLEKLSKLAGK